MWWWASHKCPCKHRNPINLLLVTDGRANLRKDMCILNLYLCFFSCEAVKKYRNFVHILGVNAFFKNIFKNKLNRSCSSYELKSSHLWPGHWVETLSWGVKTKMKYRIGSKITLLETIVQIYGAASKGRWFNISPGTKIPDCPTEAQH